MALVSNIPTNILACCNSVGLKAAVAASSATLGTSTNHKLGFTTNDTLRATLDASGNLGIGTDSPGAKLDVRGTVILNEAGGDYDVRMEGDTDANLFFLDASTDRIGIGTATPSHLLDVEGVANFATCIVTPTVCTTGNTVIGGDLTVSGDDITLGTNTSGYIIVADGTNYNPVAVSGDVTINSAGAVTIVADAVENSMLANCVITLADGDGNSTAVALGGTMSFNGTSNEVEVSESSGTLTVGLPSTVSGLTTVSATNLTGTLSTAAQPNITSVGTLTSICTSGAITAGGAITGSTLCSSGDLVVAGDDITMGTNTSGHILVADGTNYNPVAVSGDITINGSGVTTIGATKVTNAMLAGSIANSKLSNSSVSYGGVSLSLGASDATPAFNLSDATAYPGDTSLVCVGTIAGGTWQGTVIDTAYIGSTLCSKTLCAPVLNGTISGSSFLDEDDFSSDSATSVASQQSIKAYVDAIASGLDLKSSSHVATTANLSASYNNGTAGVGATLTNSGTQEALSIDGDTLVSAERVLVKDQTAACHNGIYTVTTVGNGSTNWVLTRATDYDTSTEITSGSFTFVETGTTNGDHAFVMTTDGTITVGTTAINWTQFSGAGQITAGAGLTKSGSTINVGAGSNITVNADDVALSTTITGLSALTSTAITGTLQTAAQANITSVGTLTSLCSSGDITLGGDLTIAGDDLFMTTNTSGYLLIADGTNYNPTAVSGDVTINSSGATTIGATTVTNAMLAGSIANAKLSNSSVSYGGISVSLGSADATPAFDLTDATNYPTSSLVGTITNTQLAGSIANAKLANSTITVSDGSNTTAIALGGTATFSGTSNEVEVAESSGTVTIGLPSTVSGLTNVSATNLTGTLATAAQANVTSVGTLTSLAVSGDITIDTTTLKVNSTTNRVGIGTATPSHLLDVEGVANVATCIITPIYCVASEYVLPSADGSAGQVMCTDGSGGLAFATNTPASPGGSDTFVQFNDGSSFGGSANFTWDDTTVKASNFCTAGTATLATVDINAGDIDGTTIGAAAAAAGTFLAIVGTTLTASGNVSFDGGTFIFNETGADKDFRIEGDTEANLFITDASTDRIGVGTATPSHLVDIEGVAHASTCFVSADLCATTKVVGAALCVGGAFVLPTSDGSAGQVMCTDGSGGLAFATNTPTSPGGSDTYVQFNNSGSFGGSANLTWDDTTLATTAFTATGNVSLNGGTFVFNEAGADKDFRIEGDSEANLFITDASTDRIGIGTATPSHLVDIEGVGHASTCFVSADLCATTKVVSAALCVGSEYALPTSDGSAGQILCTDGSGTIAFAAAASSGHTIAEEGTPLASRTCLNFIGTAVTATDNSGTNATDVSIGSSAACIIFTTEDGSTDNIVLTGAATVGELQCDSSPALGGNLDVNGNSIVSASNGNIPITPNGTGIVIIDGICHPTSDGSAGQVLCTNGSAALQWATVSTDPAGSDTYIQFNNGGAFGAAAGLTWDDTTFKASNICTAGTAVVGGDLTIAGDDLTMGTNTSGYILVADGTNYNPVAVSGDVTISSAGAITIAAGAVENSMLDNCTVSYGGVQLVLGGTDATPAFDLSDATAYTGDSSLVTVGTITSGTWQGTAIATGNIAATLTSKTLCDPVLVGTISGNAFLDEDNMASDSASKVASQQSIKAYVDSVASGLDMKCSSHVATTANLTASYSNGSSGVGATLTNAGTQAALSIDGQTLASSERVLIKDQTAACHNGIYSVTTVGDGSTNWVITRTTDFDSSTEVTSGAFTFVETGSTNGDHGFVMTSDGTITIGTTAINWTQFSGAGQITAGAGMTKTGNTLNVIAGDNITVNADDVALSTTITGITSISSTCFTGTLQTAAQGNVTSVGTLSSLCVSGTLDAGGNVSLNGGTFVFNEAGADKDFRIEGDSEANLFISDASVDRIGIGTATPSHLLDIEGVGHAATCFVSADLCATTKIVGAAICMGGAYALPTSDGTAGYILCTNGSGAISFAEAASSGHTIAEDGSVLTDRTCLNFCGAAVTVTDCSSTNSTDVQIRASGACLPVRVTDGTQCFPCLTSATIAAPCLQCDSAPKLGGDLDVNGNSIISASNGNIPITPNGTGSVVISKISVTGDSSFDGGSFVFNESGADKDFRIEGDTDANLFIADASVDRIGIGTATPSHLLDVDGVAHVATCLITPKVCITSQYALPASDGSAGQILCTDGSGATTFAAAASSGHTISEEGTALASRTCLNFIGSAVTATDNSGTDATDVTVCATSALLGFRVAGGTACCITLSSAAVGESLVSDTSPQLGGNLDVNGNSIVSASNGNIPITPNGSGIVIIDGICHPIADGSAGQLLCTDGSAALKFATASAGVTLAGSTNNTIATVTGANALAGEANLTFDGLNLLIDRDDTAVTQALEIKQSGTGDPAILFHLTGVQGWYAGIDNSASDLFYINTGSGNTGNGINITTAGDVGIGSANFGPSDGATVTTLRVANFGSQGDIGSLELAGQQSSGTGSSVIGNIDFLGYASDGGAVNARAIIRAETKSEYRNSELTFYTQPTSGGVTERMRIDSSGKVGIGTASMSQKLDIRDDSGGLEVVTICNAANCGRGLYLNVGCGNTSHGIITAQNNPGTAMLKFTGDGKLGIGTTTPGGVLTATETGTDGLHLFMLQKTNASAAGNFSYWDTNRTSSTGFNYGSWTSGTGPSSKQEFLLTGDGNGKADGTWQDNVYDYAEYFESATGVASELGRSVVLDDGKMRYYDASTDDASSIIGITRPKKNAKGPSIHNVAWNGWHERYVTDDFGQYAMEDVTVWSWDKIEAVEASEGVEAVQGREEGGVYERDELAKNPDWTPPADATSSTQSVRKQNPDYDPSLADDYKSREDRDEWWLIGLLGQVQIKSDETKHPRWIKMKDISDAVELWMVR